MLVQSLYQGTVTSSRVAVPDNAKAATLTLTSPATAVIELLEGNHWREIPAQTGAVLTWNLTHDGRPSAARFSLDLPALASIGGTLTIN